MPTMISRLSSSSDTTDESDSSPVNLVLPRTKLLFLAYMYKSSTSLLIVLLLILRFLLKNTE